MCSRIRDIIIIRHIKAGIVNRSAINEIHILNIMNALVII